MASGQEGTNDGGEPQLVCLEVPAVEEHGVGREWLERDGSQRDDPVFRLCVETIQDSACK